MTLVTKIMEGHTLCINYFQSSIVAYYPIYDDEEEDFDEVYDKPPWIDTLRERQWEEEVRLLAGMLYEHNL
jgi:hypothetical protein